MATSEKFHGGQLNASICSQEDSLVSQPVSLAGKQLGARDDRWLWPEFSRAIRLLRPSHVLVENVPGLLVRGMGEILGDLAHLGYNAQWDCIPASAFGARHIRERLFIIATTGALDHADCFDSRSFSGSAGAYQRWQSNNPIGSCFDGGTWAREPGVARVAYGIPDRLDRLAALGNAVVPQVAEWLGRRILQATEAPERAEKRGEGE